LISRRHFLATGTFAWLSVASSRSPLASPEAPDRLGVQLYVLRAMLAKDFDGTLAQVAKLGIKNVEFAGFYNRTAKQVRASLANTGLTAIGAHCLLASMSDDEVQRTIEFCQQVGMPYMIAAVPSIKPNASGKSVGNPFQNMALEDFRWSADRFNTIGRKVRDAGMRFAYHNHNIEARKYGNVVALDEIIRLTDPSVVALEFDTGNFIAGGGDPYPYLTRYPDRFELAHVKEWAGAFTPTLTSDFPKYANFGTGTTDWKKMLNELKKAGVKQTFIEQDGTKAGDELAVVRQAHNYLLKV
jgi:sugar phosphate isomerase/epimerase